MQMIPDELASVSVQTPTKSFLQPSYCLYKQTLKHSKHIKLMTLDFSPLFRLYALAQFLHFGSVKLHFYAIRTVPKM